jgi:signal transduction histidine kinase
MLLVNGLTAVSLVALYVTLFLLVLPQVGVESRNLAHSLATVAVAVAVVPFRQRFVRLWNHLLRRDWQNSQELLTEITSALSRTIDPRSIRVLLVDDLPYRLGLSRATLWMLSPPEDLAFIDLGHQYAQSPIELLAQGMRVSPIRHARIYIQIDPDTDASWAQPFLDQGIQLLFPLRVGNRLIGIYGCGNPINGRLFSPHVIDLIAALAPSCASALENARTYTVIARLNQQLYAFDRLKSEFIESVGHELRTPLTSLSLATQLIESNPHLAHELTTILQENVARLQQQIERVISFNLAETSTSSTFAAIDINELIAQVLEVFVPMARIYYVDLKCDIQPGLAAWGDRARLRRAIHEVVDNAVRYGGSGTVSISAALSDGLAIVRVRDQGVGIPEDEQPLLFSVYYRGRQTRALSSTPGVGLGLTIAKREIEALSGRVWLEQSGPTGSTMCIALPAVIAEEAAQEERVVGQRL